MLKLTARGIGILLAVVIVFIGVGIAIMFITGTAQKWTADWRGDRDQTESIKANADYRIAAYDAFFAQCAAIQTKEAELAAARVELELHAEGSYRYNQLLANITAITAARAELINEYNADAAREDTAGNFRASDLPYTINIDEESTQCASSE